MRRIPGNMSVLYTIAASSSPSGLKKDISSSCNRVAVLNKGELCYLGEPVGMTELAEKVVWQFLIDPGEFEELRKRVLVVHHMRVGEQIRVRCLAAGRPRDDAKQVKPMLEDAYIWVMRQTEETHARA